MKNDLATFPIYFTDHPENRSDLVSKYGSRLFLIHTGHILKAELSKEENEKNLQALAGLGFNLINLTLEDFIVADTQQINLENFNDLAFINSSIIDLNVDGLVTAKNIAPSIQYEGMAFIGLSDEKLAPTLAQEKFIISDYVLSILKVKKSVLKTNPTHDLKSFIIIHTLDDKINDIMLRLPPSLTNANPDTNTESLAD
jgi:hypothetical protein